MKLSKYVLIFLVSTCKVYALSTPASAYELTTPGGIIAHISADKATRYVGAGTPLYNGCELNVRVSQGGKDDPVLLGVNFHDTCMHGLVEKSVSDAVDNSARITDAKIAVATAALNAKIDQLQQQLQEALSKKIDETVTAKLTDSSSTLVSKAVGNKLAEKSGDTTVLSNAVIDALKVTDDRSALNQDSEGKPLAANKFKIKGLSNYSLDGHHFIMATLSGSYDCSSALTNIIYLPMDGNESSTQAMLLSTAFAFHRTVDVNPDPQSHEVVANVPVESAYAHNCVLNTVNVN